jgi:peptidyl-tRNA hydrolase
MCFRSNSTQIKMEDKPWVIFGMGVGSAALIFGIGLASGAFLRRIFPGTPRSALSGTDSFDRAARLALLRSQGLGRNHKMIFVVRTDLGMGKGKIAAQCSHAAVMCYQKAMVTDTKNLDLWEATGTAKICLKADGDDSSLRALQLQAQQMKIVSAIVRDGGHTQVCIIK